MGSSARDDGRRSTVDKKVVRKERIIRRKIWKLNENQTKVRFEKRVKELVSSDAPDL